MKPKAILVTGSNGLLGSAIRRQAAQSPHRFIFTTRSEADLEKADQAAELVGETAPDAIIHCAAVVGGIKINMEAPEQMRDRNRAINRNVLEAALKYKVPKTVSFLSTCIFPEAAAEPWTEKVIHDGETDRRQWGYAAAKRELDLMSREFTKKSGGSKFVTLVPSTMYGPNDNFSPENGHVLPAVFLKLQEAKQSGTAPVFWGSGAPRREFLFADDVARAAIAAVDSYDDAEPVIVSPGDDVSVKSLVDVISEEIGYKGPVEWDRSKPDGRVTRRTSNEKFRRLFPGFRFTPFNDGIRRTAEFFRANHPRLRGLQ